MTGNPLISSSKTDVNKISATYGISPADALYYQALTRKMEAHVPDPVMGLNNIPAALMTPEAQNKMLGVFDGRAVMEDMANVDAAAKAELIVMELKGGIGSSVVRTRTLQRLTGRTNLADKATDIFFEGVTVNGFDAKGAPKQFQVNINIGESKLLNYIYLVGQGHLKSLSVQELVNDESLGPVNAFWDSVYLNDRIDERIPDGKKRTYRQVFAQTPGLTLVKDFIVQGTLPVLDAQTRAVITNKKLWAPGGHGFFAVLTMDANARRAIDAVPMKDGADRAANTSNAGTRDDRTAAQQSDVGQSSGGPSNRGSLITVFTNGDGLNNMLPAPVAGLMLKARLPIVMVTTPKQVLDMKGGIIGLMSPATLPQNLQTKVNEGKILDAAEFSSAGTLYPYLLEIAQAKAANQEKMHRAMGLTIGGKFTQLFNTNIHAQNHQVLDPFLADLRAAIGEEKFYEVIAPDLIMNPKKKKDGEREVNVVQLEGASGSALLALNRFVMTSDDPKVKEVKARHRIDRLVYFVNFGPELRPLVFTPEKYAWDHYLYAFTDLFAYNPTTSQLDFTPSSGRTTLPGLDLDKYYEDLENDINAFGHLGVKELDYLAIRGAVHLSNAILKGGVFINNKSVKEIDLNTLNTACTSLSKENGRLVLSNIILTINLDGTITQTPVTNLLDAIHAFGG